MTLAEPVVKNIIRKLLKGDDYRIEVVTLLNALFLQYAIDFFKKIVDAKLKNKNIDIDWYKKEFLNLNLSSQEIAINAGLNRKTISNMYNEATRSVMINASYEHYDTLYNAIKELIEVEHELDLKLTLKLNNVSVDLNVSETLIVINTLAVKRAEIRGGLWSTAGKRVEKPLMLTLCKLFKVSNDNFAVRVKSKKGKKPDFEREIDFYLINNDENNKCEVKLMGKGNPESADAVIARASKVFIADKLSQTNINQLNSLNVEWVQLRSKLGFRRFETVLKNLNIRFEPYSGDINKDLDKVFLQVF
jgi:hypothetical protein